MRSVRGVLLVLLTLGVSACASVQPGVSQGPRAERPTYTLGDKWIRNDGEYEVIRIENDRYVFSAGAGREIELTKDLAVARVRRGEDMMAFDPPPKLAWPLAVGKNGYDRFTWHRSWNPSGSASVAFTWKVEAYEDVQTLAGTFKAFRIVESLRWRQQRGRGMEAEKGFVIWYAPEVRQLVKAVGSGSTEAEHLNFLAFEVLAVDRTGPAPLQVALREPKDQARVTTEGITVTGKATGGTGVARVTVTLNGVEVSRQDATATPKTEVALEIPIMLREGKNILLVTAADPGGATQQEARTLYFDKPAAPPTPTATPPVIVTPPPVKTPPPAPPVVTPPLETPTPAPPIVATPSPPAPSLAPAPPVVAAPPPPPFQVTLSSPQDQARVEQETIGLAGMVTGGEGVSRVVVSLNGVEISHLGGQTPQRSLAVNLPIQLREGSNTLVVTAMEPDGTISQEVRAVHYEKRVPLTVSVRYPEDKSHLSDEASVVAALAISSKGIARVTVSLNGVEVHQQTERNLPKSLAASTPVTLREGANVVVVSASEPDGTMHQEIRTVFYDKPKVVETLPPPPPAPPSRDQWAVVIGAGRYESSEVPRLRYTVPDAEGLYQILIGPAGFKQEHVLLLTDQTERKPTLRNIKWALGTYLARSAKKDDTVLIFFAGHGAPEVDQQGVERDGLAKYLVPIDADPDDLYSTALPMDELQTIFNRIEAERVVVFLDACYSGAAGGRTFASKKTRAMNVDDLFLERLTRSKGRAILTASRPAEVSLELPELGHGVFTYYLIEGLKGAADLNHDGIVTLQELYEYLEQQVTQKARSVGGNQHPVMKGELEGVLPLLKVQGP
ncbi:MAG: caspase family protein [Candidatus Methylomirabilota bacterium]